jgi:hypothetical protein
MPSRSETARAREQLQFAAPISDDASLMKLQQSVAELLREAELKDELGPDEVATVIDEIARKYFQHMLRKQERLIGQRR